MKKTALILVLLFSVCLCAKSVKHEPGVGLTVYNDDFAVIKDNRNLDFQKGINTFRFTDVASRIDPTSMRFECLSSPGAVKILEQNYEFDLVSKQSLLKRYIDREVMVSIKGSGADPGEEIGGTLAASLASDIILKQGQEIEIIKISSIESITLAKAPADLVTKPTLVWLAQADKQGSHLCQVTYTTSHISWKADYSAVLNASDDMIDLSGWVTIKNLSGAGYKDAKIKLLAGDVRRVDDEEVYRGARKYALAMEAADASGFQEKAFAEYHLYTLGRRSTINNNQVKQIELIDPVANVPATKLFVYNRQKNPKKVQIKIEFLNTEENGLGIALPKGKIRAFKRDDADGSLEFIGEDNIDHTAKKEKLSLYIGDAFDIVPEHKVLESKTGPRRGQYRERTEKHQVELRNRKNEPVTVYVDEKFGPWVNWKIKEKTHDLEKKDANTARFKIDIPADSTVQLIFTSVQNW